MHVYHFRCDNNAQFFHHFQRFPIDVARRVESDGDERLGRRLYVFHLREFTRICLRELRRP